MNWDWRKFCWRCLFFGLTFLGSLVIPTIVLRYIGRDPIVRIDAISAAGDVQVARGRINIRSRFDKIRYCDTEVGRFLWRDEPHDGVIERVIVPLTATNTALTGVGPDQHVVISLDVPPHLAAGLWYYYAIAEDHCGPFLPMEVRRTPDVPLDLAGAD